MIEITTKDLLEELCEDFKKTLSELSFEKAAKGYKKMRDAEWNRVFMIQIDWRERPVFKEMDDENQIKWK